MSDDGSDIGSRLARSLADFVRDVGLAVAEGQQELDRNSLNTQLGIDRDAEEEGLPHLIEAPWYRFAEVDVDARLHVDTAIEPRRSRDETEFYRPRLTVRPPGSTPEGRTEHHDATSSIHFRIIPVPPDLPADHGGAEDGPERDA
ncbi:MAG: hypothetical protein V5A85_07155 [Haloarculaceae archaeon]